MFGIVSSVEFPTVSLDFTTDYNAHRSMISWEGGGGGGRHTDQNNGSLRVYFVVQIPPFIDWIFSAGEECGATAEITRSLQLNRSSVE